MNIIKKVDLGLGIFDQLLLLVSGMGIIVSGYFLVNEEILLKSFKNTDEQRIQIGGVQTTKNDVRRKLGTSLLWFKVANEEVLFEGDSIFTGKRSSIKFYLNTGVELTLQANSLVVLTQKKDEVILDLQVGQFSAKTIEKRNLKNVPKVSHSKNVKSKSIKNTLKIIQKGEVAQLDLGKKAEVQVTKSKKGQLSLASKKGEVKLKVNEREERFDETEIIEIKKDLKIEKKQIKLTLLAPENKQNIWFKNDSSNALVFKWDSNDDQLEYELIVSKDRDFSNKVFSQKTKNKHFNVSKIFPDKNYFWKVISKTDSGSDKQEEYSESLIYELETHLVRPLVTYFPIKDYEIELEESETSVQLQFQWEHKNIELDYELQVSKDEDFNQIIKNIKTKESEYILKDIAPGSFYWRVRALLGDSLNKEYPWSYPMMFSVVIPKIIPLAKLDTPLSKALSLNNSLEKLTVKEAELELKEINEKEEPLNAPLLEKANLSSVSKLITLKWLNKNEEQKIEELAFELEIASDKNFSEVIKKELLKDNNYVWSSANAGEFFWRIKSVAKNRKSSEWSLTEIIKVEASEIKFNDIKKIMTFKEIKKFNKKQKIKLAWNKILNIEIYKIQIFDKNKSKILTEILDKNEFELMVSEDSTFFYSVEPYVEGGRQISSTTKLKSVVFKKNLELPAPKLSIPSDGMEIISFGDEDEADPILFKWTEVEGVEYYVIQLSKDKNFKTPHMELKVKNAELLMTESARGKYFWRVKSVYKDYESPWSSPRGFSM